MAQSPKEEIQEAFNKASSAITELENTIRKYHDTPRENINSNEYQKLLVPGAYIRTRGHYAVSYNLNFLIENKKHRDSIAYSLMQSDLYNYFINRFQVWGIVQKLLLKAAIINLVSAIEGILMCSIGNLHKHCRFDRNTICKHQSRCTFYIKSSNNMRISGAVDVIRDKLLMNEEVILSDITILNNIRNNVHLPILLRHEFTNDDYSISNYNKAIKVLKYFKANQKSCTEEFLQKRTQGCAGLTRP